MTPSIGSSSQSPPAKTPSPLPSARIWLAFFVALSGLINVVEGLVPKSFEVLEWLAQHLPFHVTERSRMFLLLGGVLQLALSRGLARGKHAAWALCLAILLISSLLHIGRAFDWHHAIMQTLVAVALIYWRKDFVARSDGPSVRWALIIGLFSAVLVTLFGLIALNRYGAEIDGGQDLATHLRTIATLVFSHSSDANLPLTPRAEMVFTTIGEISLFFAGLILFLLLRPILRRQPQTEEERNRARGIIARYGNDSFDAFALLPDKRYHFSGHGDSTCVTAYALWRDIAVALSAPVGPENAIPSAIREFDAYCRKQDWLPVFYEIPATMAHVFESAGLRTFHIAEEARIDLLTFKLEGGKFQNLRSARNKVKKSGWTCELFAGGELPTELRTELARISNEWLAARRGVEMTFDLGSFSPESLNPADIYVLFDDQRKALGFVSWLPYAKGTGRTLDLMRHGANFHGGMDVLMVESLLDLQRRGLTEASLGSAPLANLSSTGQDQAEEKALRYIFDRFDHLYGYKSLFEFKKKYHPTWMGRHVAYRHISQVLLAATAIVRVHLPNGFIKYLRS